MWSENTGAPFHREDGSVVERGEQFDATEDELRRMAYKIRPCAKPEEPKPAEDWQQNPEWPLVLSPRLYLRMSPDGPYAALARRLTGQEEAEHGDADDSNSGT